MAATPKAVRRGSRPCFSAYDRPDADGVHAQFDRLIEAAAEKVPTGAEHLETARADHPAFTRLRRGLARVRSNNPQGRLNRESRCYTDVVGIFPDSTAIPCLVGAVSWPNITTSGAEARRYFALDVLTRSRITILGGDITPTGKEATLNDPQAPGT